MMKSVKGLIRIAIMGILAIMLVLNYKTLTQASNNDFVVYKINEARAFSDRIGNDKAKLTELNSIIAGLRSVAPLKVLEFDEISLVSDGRDGGIDIIKGEPYQIKLINRLTGEPIPNDELECFYVQNIYTQESFLPSEAVGDGFYATVTSDGTITAKPDLEVTAQNPKSFEILVKYKNAFYMRSVRVLTDVGAKVARELKEIEAKENALAEKFRYLSDVDKVMAVHDYLIENIRYGSTTDRQRAQGKQGALIDGLAVCEGYAQAFYGILSKLDVNVRSITGYMSGVLHKWNMVELDGEWYFVDVTGDDGYSGTNVTAETGVGTPSNKWAQYKYFLVDNNTLRATHEVTGYLDSNYTYGTKYIGYAYEKAGIKVNELSQIPSLVGRIYDSTNANSFYIGAYAEASLGDQNVKNALSNAIRQLGGTVDQSSISPSSSIQSAYKLSYMKVTVNPSATTDISNANATVTETLTNSAKLKISFSQPVSDFTENNISVTGASVAEVKPDSPDNTSYIVLLEKLTTADGMLGIRLHKRGYNFPNIADIYVNPGRYPAPAVAFEATGEDSGVLTGVGTSMAYQINAGNYIQINSNENIVLNGLTQGTTIRVVDVRNLDRATAPKTVFKLTKNTQPDYIYSKASVSGGATGELLGVSQYMEYRLSTDSEWQPISGIKLTNLSEGTYYIRNKGYRTALASEPLVITVAGGAVPDTGSTGGNESGSAASPDSGAGTGGVNGSTASPDSGAGTGGVNDSTASPDSGAGTGGVNGSTASPDSGAGTGGVNGSTASPDSGAGTGGVNDSTASSGSAAGTGDSGASSSGGGGSYGGGASYGGGGSYGGGASYGGGGSYGGGASYGGGGSYSGGASYGGGSYGGGASYSGGGSSATATVQNTVVTKDSESKKEPKKVTEFSLDEVTDVDDIKYTEEVQFVLEQRLMSTNAEGSFNPAGTVKVTSFAKILAKLSGVDTKNRTEYKKWIKDIGLMTDVSTDTKTLSFKTVEQMLKNYKKFEDFKRLISSTVPVSEIKKTKQDKALEKFIKDNLFINGRSGKSKSVTREELSRIIYLLAK